MIGLFAMTHSKVEQKEKTMRTLGLHKNRIRNAPLRACPVNVWCAKIALILRTVLQTAANLAVL